MKCLKSGLIFIFCLSCLAPCQIHNANETKWLQGKEAANEGNLEKALSIWQSARSSDDIADRPDPRIGIGYIELATKHKLYDYYREASRMYSWGISGTCEATYQKELTMEFERIKPILSKDDLKGLKESLKNNLSDFCTRLTKFWTRLDPTISTDYNERLIEHWERIAYAKKHFTRNSSTVYDSDERALTYIRLGEPDFKRHNVMRYNKTQVRAWVLDLMDYRASRGGIGGISGSDSASSGGASVGGLSSGISQSMFNNRKRLDMADTFSSEAEQLHRIREYDIWVYYRENEDTPENLVYIFGEHGDTGFYGELNSLEDMIPDAAFRTGGVQNSMISSGYLLQLLFYQQVLTIDDYFAEAFSNLESRLFSINGLNKSSAFTARSKHINKLSYIQVHAPKEKSSYIEELSGVELTAYQYRLLDEDDKPYLATFVVGKPQKAFVFDQVKTKNYDFNDYQLRFLTKSNDHNYNVVDSQSINSPIHLERRGYVDEMKPSFAYFKIPQLDIPLEQFFTVELLNREKDPQIIGDRGFPETLRAIGKINKIQPEPLSTGTEKLVVSDIIIGSNLKPSGPGESGPTNFKVIHNRRIPENENLMIHFEVYHLESKSPEPNEFRVEFRVRPERRNIFQRIFKGGDQTGLTLNYETFDSYYKSDLEIVTSPFQTGKYELELKVIEPSTDRTVIKKISFEIVDKSE